jgi:GTP-binding protein
MKPVMALVGRPNVGKSTLFNRLTKSRDAIVADFAGLTRDRHYGNARQGRTSSSSSTPAASSPTPSGIFKEMAKQTRQAVAEADVVVFVVDAREGPVGAGPRHRQLPAQAGQADGAGGQQGRGHDGGRAAHRVLRAGLGEVHGISAAHGQGIRSLVDCRARAAEPARDDEEEAVDEGVIKLAVAGRPNVGKSTLINTWLGEERLVAFDLPGTTRDAISVPFERNGKRFELIDTAGLRRKGKVFEAIEKFSVVKTLQAIESANVVLLLLDATRA